MSIVTELQGVVRGRVIAPEDDDYDRARAVVYGGIDRRPAAIALVADAEDAARVVTFARERDIELAVRSGGHSGAGHSVTEGGIVLDLRDLRALHIDPGARTGWAEAGLTAAEFTTAAGDHGLAIGFGDSGTVGLGGITLGGGIGFLVRKHGMTIDSLIGAEVVTADGRVIEVDEERHPDLFWAIRGGGGNFGVVTRFTFRLHPLDRVVGGLLLLPATPEAIAAFVAEAEAAPDELSTIANVMPAPPMPFVPEEAHGQLVNMAIVVWSGELEEGREVMSRLRGEHEPIADLTKEMPYADIYGIFGPEDEEYHPTAVGRTMFLDRVDLKVAQTIVRHLEASDAAMRVAQLRVLGGAMARIAPGATAFAHRTSRIMANLAAFYEGEEDRAGKEAWVDGLMAELRQEDAGAYVNFINDEGPERVHAAYPEETWSRLSRIKARYDPANLFRLNHNVPPAQ